MDSEDEMNLESGQYEDETNESTSSDDERNSSSDDEEEDDLSETSNGECMDDSNDEEYMDTDFKNQQDLMSAYLLQSNLNDAGKDGQEIPNVDQPKDVNAGKKKKGTTVPYFSQHRLDQSKFPFKPENMDEKEMIIKLMFEVNKRYKEAPKYVEKIPQEPLAPPAQTFAPFSILAYVQKTIHQDQFLSHLQIGVTYDNINTLVFYFRPKEIYVITNGNSWKTIQGYCCYKFPYIISSRIAKEGSLKESFKSLTGNTTKTDITKKTSIKPDPVNNIRYLAVKVVRSNSSIYQLKEFQSLDEKGVGKRIKFIIGFAYLRIERKMKTLENLPEILDYFSRIYNGEETRASPNGAEREEDNSDDVPLINPTNPVVKKECDKLLCIKIQNYFMQASNPQALRGIELCHKYIEPFTTSTCFVLRDGQKTTSIGTFDRLPTIFEVCNKLRQYNLLNTTTATEFQKRFQRIKLTYESENGKEERTKLLKLLESEITLQVNESTTDYIQLLENWWKLSEDYYQRLHKSFGGLLKREGLLIMNVSDYLPLMWQDSQMKSVIDYRESYKNFPELANYFVPNSDSKFMFDLMQVVTSKREQRSIIIYYIFDRFDPSIRGASTRLEKSLEKLTQKRQRETHPLTSFYNDHVSNSEFRRIFPDLSTFFKTFQGTGKVTVVAAFRTSVEGVPLATRRNRSLQDEKNLMETFSEQDIENRVIGNLSQSSLNNICNEMRRFGAENVFREVVRMIGNSLTDDGWCVAAPEQNQLTVSGKLLKLRNPQELRIFADTQVNSEIFYWISRHFSGQFPGIYHKLECLSMWDLYSPSHKSKYIFKIMEILDEDKKDGEPKPSTSKACK